MGNLYLFPKCVQSAAVFLLPDLENQVGDGSKQDTEKGCGCPFHSGTNMGENLCPLSRVMPSILTADQKEMVSWLPSPSQAPLPETESSPNPGTEMPIPIPALVWI